MSYRNLKLHTFNLLTERNWSCSRQTYLQRERESQPATRSLNVLMLAFTERCHITAYKIAHRELNYFWPSPVETARTLVPACHCKEDITRIVVVACIENTKFSKIFRGWRPLQVVHVNHCFRNRLLSVIRALTWVITRPFHTPYPHQAGASNKTCWLNSNSPPPSKNIYLLHGAESFLRS